MERKLLIPSKDILWNDQKNNERAGFITGGSQCGYTSVTRVYAQVRPELFNLSDEKEVDKNILALIDDMEPKVGKPGWGEKFLLKATSGRFRSSHRLGSYLDIYDEYLKDQVEPFGYTTVCKLVGGKWEEVEQALDLQLVVMIGTMITPSGHFICIVDHDKDYYICLDPYGDALTGYKNKNGDKVKYPKNWLKARCLDGAQTRGLVRFLRLTLKQV